MDRWIRTAWRAFWVGLGASAVLITQSFLAPPKAMPTATQVVPAYDLPWAPPRASNESASPAKTVDRLVPHDPFDAMGGHVVARVRDES